MMLLQSSTGQAQVGEVVSTHMHFLSPNFYPLLSCSEM